MKRRGLRAVFLIVPLGAALALVDQGLDWMAGEGSLLPVVLSALVLAVSLWVLPAGFRMARRDDELRDRDKD